MIRHERQILPGMLLGRDIFSSYRSLDADITDLGRSRIRVTVERTGTQDPEVKDLT